MGGDKKAIIVDEYNILCAKIKHEHGLKWGLSHLDKIFNNTFYHGIMWVNGKSYPHCYPPLIRQALFEEVQMIRKTHGKKVQYYKGKEFLYRWLLRRGDCNLAVSPERHKGHAYYHYTQYNGKHGAKLFREEALTEEFSHSLKDKA